MKKLIAITAASSLGLFALQGCAVDQDAAYESEEDVGFAESALTGSATVTQTAVWNNGKNFCVDVKLTNGLPNATAMWQVAMDLKATRITSLYNFSGAAVGATGHASMLPVSYNTQIAPGGSTTFSFCASAPDAYTRPVIRAWNMKSDDYAACMTNSGVNPAKAALAVAMAKELGRWNALSDLRIGSSGRVELNLANSFVTGKCGSNGDGCPNTKALLNQADQVHQQFFDQNVFNITTYREELKASMDRQLQRNTDLQRNQPWNMPVDHVLSLVSGPTNIGTVQNGVSASCGPHYIFKVTKTNGANLTSTEASNLRHALCFNGEGDCGNDNPFIGFTSAGLSACPSGATCVAVDPTDGDVGSDSTTSAGNAVSYPYNKVYNPTNSLLNTACMKVSGSQSLPTGVTSVLSSRCSSYPTTCGWLYCI
jgi:hypothetical protein